MADVIVKILEPADSFNLLTPEQARIGMQLDPGDPSASEDFLNQLIEVNSSIISTMCARVFARERVRETWRCLGEPCDCEDAASSRRLFLSHWPVKEQDIQSVEIPRGNPVPSGCWELDEQAGRLSVFCGTAEPIVVTYWGGFELPDEAPPALRYAALQLVGSSRADAQAQSSSAMLATGIRSISHKESRVQFHSPSQTESARSGGGGKGTTPTLDSVKNLLMRFTRLWI